MDLSRLMGDLNNDSLFRFHLAKTEPEGAQPLDALAKSDDDWLEWQIYSGDKRQRFVKDFIVSFAQISGSSFLFGGIFKIKSRSADGYDVEYTDKHQDLIGRLVLNYTGNNWRSTCFTPSYIFSNSQIKGINESRYHGERFISFDEINHDFGALEVIVKNDLLDWKAALKSVFGIYLITDKETGKHYIGSAYGEDGIWGRWSSYIYTYHGNNTDLIDIFKEKDALYFKKNFKFCILEIIPSTKSQDEVIRKESLWKEKLFTRKFGLNKN